MGAGARLRQLCSSDGDWAPDRCEAREGSCGLAMLVVTNTLLNRVWQMWNVWHMNSLDIAKRLEIKEPKALKLVEMARNRNRGAHGAFRSAPEPANPGNGPATA